MDPRLSELALEGGADDEVMVVLRLRDAHSTPERVRVVARFGAIVTARLRRGDIAWVRSHRAVASMKAPFGIIPDLAKEFEGEPIEMGTDPVPTDLRRPPDLSPTGRGIVVGVVDWGLDFAHPNFRRADGDTRLLALWDQRSDADSSAPRPYGYGRIHDASAINRALRQQDPFRALRYDPERSDTGGGTHGTHVTDIAAGGGRVGPAGLAPEADLVFVDLAASRGGFPGLGDSVSLLEALDFIARTADGRPLAINMSMGNIAGPHDGSTLVEQAIDAFVMGTPGRAVIQSCGNYYTRDTHAALLLRPGAVLSLDWLIDPADVTPNRLEIWYPGTDRVRARLRSPLGATTSWLGLGETGEVTIDGRIGARMYHRARDPNNGDHEIAVFAYPGGPSGNWTVSLEGEDIVDGRLNAWIERDEQCAACQSHFHPTQSAVAGTTGTICNSRRTIAVGAHDAHASGFTPGTFSSMGPTRDGRQKPDLIAPGVSVLAARSTPVGASSTPGRLTRKSGTSMAAPHVTGAVALMFQAALPNRLSIQRTRKSLLSAASMKGIPAVLTARVGSGVLDTPAAIAAVIRARPSEDPMKEEEPTTVLTEEGSDAVRPFDGAGEGMAGQLMTSSGTEPLNVAARADYSSTTLDDALQFALWRRSTSWLIRGNALHGTQFDCLRLSRAVHAGGTETLDADVQGCDAAVLGGEAYIHADPVARGTRWVRLPRAREFYALADPDRRTQRQEWVDALAGANPAIVIPGVAVDRAWLGDRSMPTLRGLMAHFAAGALPVRSVNQPADNFSGASVRGRTLPLLAFPLREPECYLPVIAAREGKMEAINAYDLGAGISLGPIQFNLQRSAVIRFLNRFMDRDRALFGSVFGVAPQPFGMRTHGDHLDLVVDATGTNPVTLHGVAADERRNIAWFQSGQANPAQATFAHIDQAHRRALAARFRDGVAWPHVQEIVIESSGWFLEPGLSQIDVPANGIPRIDPQEPDRDLFILKALLMSAYVRFSACLAPLLQALRRWNTVPEKLHHLQDALNDPAPAWGHCTPARRNHLRNRLQAQRLEADRIYEVIQRLRQRRAGEVEERLAVNDEAMATNVELDWNEAPCGGELLLDEPDEGLMERAVCPLYLASAALDRALSSCESSGTADDAASWLFALAREASEAQLAEFDILGRPGAWPTGPPLCGDLIVEWNGEPASARIGVVTRDHEDSARQVETDLLFGPSQSVPERRLFRADGRLGAGTLLLRPRADMPAEQGVDPFDCGGGVRVSQALVEAVAEARRRASETLPLATPACNATPRCPVLLQASHQNGGATHLVRLGSTLIRVAELAGLWGVDLTQIQSIARKEAQAVKLLLPAQPFDGLDFVAIRSGNHREIHLGLAADRRGRVDAVVNGAPWGSLAFAAEQRQVPYVLTKVRYSDASLHRQWGLTTTIDWILGLAAFYLSQTGSFLGVGDVSHVVGESITDHHSHKEGRDVDLYVVDFPNPSTGIPEMYLCEGGDERRLTLRPLIPPASTAQNFGAAGATLGGARLHTVRRRYATIVAYGLATWDQLNACTWHGATWVLAEAQAIARAAVDGGWHANWGPAPPQGSPAGPQDGAQLSRKLIGQGNASYGEGRGWPPHKDHLHVRLNV